MPELANFSTALFVPLIAFAIAGALVWVFSKSRLGLDRPNHRSLHQTPIPRTGGIGVLAGIFSAWLLVGPQLLPLAIAMMVLAGFSLYDDFKSLGAMFRLLIHIAVATLFFYSEAFERLNVGGLILVSFITGWIINLYNFMDGSDGLAGGMTVIGFAFYAIAASADASLSSAAWAISAASLAFLLFNFHPAKIFLGDSGSIPIGFAAAAFGYIGWERGFWSWWYPFTVFSPFIADASVTLLKRIIRRERIWQAHKEHYYQRLIRMGWGHRRTALTEYTLMLIVSTAATTALYRSTKWQAGFLFACAACYAALTIAIDARWRSHFATESRSE